MAGSLPVLSFLCSSKTCLLTGWESPALPPPWQVRPPRGGPNLLARRQERVKPSPTVEGGGAWSLPTRAVTGVTCAGCPAPGSERGSPEPLTRGRPRPREGSRPPRPCVTASPDPTRRTYRWSRRETARGWCPPGAAGLRWETLGSAPQERPRARVPRLRGERASGAFGVVVLSLGRVTGPVGVLPS